MENLEAVSTGEPIYWPTDSRKILDVINFCVVKEIHKRYMKAKSSIDLSSDHSPIIFTLCRKLLETNDPVHSVIKEQMKLL